MTFEESTILIHIDKLGKKATPVELSRQLLRKHHSITGLLLRMEKKGLIIRNKDLKRKNMIRVSMTDKGKAMFHNAKMKISLKEWPLCFRMNRKRYGCRFECVKG